MNAARSKVSQRLLGVAASERTRAAASHRLGAAARDKDEARGEGSVGEGEGRLYPFRVACKRTDV